MTSRRTIWIGAGLLLAAVWLAVAAGLRLARAGEMTAEKVERFLVAHPLETLPPARRLKVVENLAGRVNRLSLEERRRFRYEGALRGFFESLTGAERARYLDLTLPGGFQQLMDAFNRMEPERRRATVERALDELRRAAAAAPGGEAERVLSDELAQKVVNEGFRAYFAEASADAKLDLQPLIEEVQRILRTPR